MECFSQFRVIRTSLWMDVGPVWVSRFRPRGPDGAGERSPGCPIVGESESAAPAEAPPTTDAGVLAPLGRPAPRGSGASLSQGALKPRMDCQPWSLKLNQGLPQRSLADMNRDNAERKVPFSFLAGS